MNELSPTQVILINTKTSSDTAHVHIRNLKAVRTFLSLIHNLSNTDALRLLTLQTLTFWDGEWPDLHSHGISILYILHEVYYIYYNEPAINGFNKCYGCN